MGYTDSAEREKELLLKLYSMSGGKTLEISTQKAAQAAGFTPYYTSRLAQRLSEKGFLNFARYGKLLLTAEGISYARHVTDRMETVDRFIKWLGVEEDCNVRRIEGVLSEAVVEAIKGKMEAGVKIDTGEKPVMVITPTTHCNT